MQQQMLLMPKHYKSNNFSCSSRLTTKHYFKISRHQILTRITSIQLNFKIIYKPPWLAEISSSWWILIFRTRRMGVPITRVQMLCFINSSCSSNSYPNSTSSTRFNSYSSFKALVEVFLARAKLSYKNFSRCNSNSSKKTRRTSLNSTNRST